MRPKIPGCYPMPESALDDLDTWVIAVTVRRQDGVRVRRYVRSLRGAQIEFTSRQAWAKRFTTRSEAEQSTCDVRLIREDLHPVRMVRLTRVLEDRAHWAAESRGTAT